MSATMSLRSMPLPAPQGRLAVGAELGEGGEHRVVGAVGADGSQLVGDEPLRCERRLVEEPARERSQAGGAVSISTAVTIPDCWACQRNTCWS